MTNKSEISEIIYQLNNVLLDKSLVIKLTMTCLLARGHLLLEDLPGMGKTTLASAVAQLIGLDYKRVQFTSDMLPADLIGMSIFDQNKKEFSFKEGPVFTQLLLADEINRGSSRTQSALLEAMAEYQVSVDKITYKLPQPFFVIATQNPQDQSGTFVLPESELDRFTMRLEIGYPSREAEKLMLQNALQKVELKPILSVKRLLEIQNEVDQVKVSDTAMNYLLDLVTTSRNAGKIPNPLSPRASKAHSRMWRSTACDAASVPSEATTVCPA